MTRSSDDARLSAARPAGLDPSRRTAIFSRIVTRPEGAEEVAGLVPSSHRVTRSAAFAGAAVAVAVAAGVGIPVVLGAGTGHTDASGTDLHLASYSLKLPGTYKVTDATPKPCDPVMLVTYRAGAGKKAPAARARQIASAVSAGRCVSMRLVGPYKPGGPEAPTITGIGGASTALVAEPVKVGANHALLGSFQAQVQRTGGTQVFYAVKEPVLDVIVPAADGQVENLVITSVGMSPPALLSLVAGNLSVTITKFGAGCGETVPAPVPAATITTASPATTTPPPATPQRGALPHRNHSVVVRRCP